MTTNPLKPRKLTVEALEDRSVPATLTTYAPATPPAIVAVYAPATPPPPPAPPPTIGVVVVSLAPTVSAPVAFAGKIATNHNQTLVRDRRRPRWRG
jgi:hypothetical protein